jgi:hypothetical protein
MNHHGIGTRVHHVSYGDGTVRDVNEYHTAIEFDGVGLRRFATPKVVLGPAKRGRAKKAATAKEVVPPAADSQPA